MRGNSVCLRPWKLSMLVFVSVTPGIVLSPKNASPAKSFAVSTSWSITVNNTIASGLRHCSTLTELRAEMFRVDGKIYKICKICENIEMKKCVKTHVLDCQCFWFKIVLLGAKRASVMKVDYYIAKMKHFVTIVWL